MATLKSATAKVKRAVAKPATRKKSATVSEDELLVPKVKASAFYAGDDMPWMTPEVKKIRAEYYADKASAINDAVAAAVARFEAEPKARFALHLHHERLLERVAGDSGRGGLEGAIERIRYVVMGKYPNELLARLRVMRPAPDAAIEAVKARTKKVEEPVKEARRITRAEVNVLQAAHVRLQQELDALDPKKAADAARVAVEAAWAKFHRVRSVNYYTTTYSPGDQASLDDLKSKADAWLAATSAKPDEAAIAAAKKAVDDAAKAHKDVDRAYWKQQDQRQRARYAVNLLSSDDAGLTEAQLWELHSDLCEKDCPYTKTHRSVLPR